jgi:hypothetical protein
MIQATPDQATIDTPLPSLQNTPSPSPSLQNATTPRQIHPRIAKTTQYHLLERALLAKTDESPYLIALIAGADTSELYKPRTYREAVGGGDAKQ